MSGSPSAGFHDSAPPLDRAAVRRAASAKRGFVVSGRLSELPLMKRLTISTPAARKTSPSPARMAWAAMRMVCSDDEQ